jgi:hypothetical protein
MARQYSVVRRLQEQKGSYFVILPRLWVKAEELRQGDLMEVVFNGDITISPAKVEQNCENRKVGKRR